MTRVTTTLLWVVGTMIFLCIVGPYVLLAPSILLRDAIVLQSSGYINRQGKFTQHVLHQCAYDFGHLNGLRRQEISLSKIRPDGRWSGCAFFDSEGKQAFPGEFLDAEPFSGGYAAVEFEENKWGFINKTGTVIIKPQFEDAHSFNEMLAPAKKLGKWGFINALGEWQILPRFDDARPFQEGRALIQLHNKIGFVDRTGAVVVEPDYDSAFSFSDGVALVERNVTEKKFGTKRFIDKNGKLKFELAHYPAGTATSWFIVDYPIYQSKHLMPRRGEPAFDLIRNREGYDMYDKELFHEGLLPVRELGRWTYVDTAGNTAFQSRFDSASSFSEGLALVADGEKFGFINTHGEFVVKPRFEYARSFHEGLAFVREKGGIAGYINKSGQLKIPVASRSGDDFYDGIAAVGEIVYYP